MPYDASDSRRGIGTLLRDLVEGSVSLVHDELKLAKTEATLAVTGIGTGSAFVALGAVLVLLGALALVTGVVLVVGDQWLPADRYWVAALILLVITGALAAFFARRGMHELSPAALMPNETLTTITEDKEWLKQRLTSGETSS